MPKSLVWRGFSLGALFLLFAAGVASSQMSPFPVQNNIAWGGPIQPDVGVAENHSQSAQPVSSPDGTPPDISADSPSQNPSGAPADSPDDSTSNNAASGVASNTANNPASTISDNNTVRQLGTPFPLSLQPQGVKIGPFYLPSISDSFFYASNTAPGEPTQTFAGNSVTANLVASKTLSSGTLAFQAREQVSFANSVRPYLNSSIGVTFNDQLSERWSLNASAQFTYFQNSILSNPEYLLSYQNSGVVQQTLFVQQNVSTVYETNNIALSYSLSGSTHLTLSPVIGATFLDQQQGWTSTRQFGGAVGVSHDFTPNLTLGAYYTLYYNVTSGIVDSPGFTSQSIGLSFQYKFAQSWSVAGSLASSGQLIAKVWELSPTGSVRVLKSFSRSRSSISAAYTRAEASNVFISSGYYDQGDISYNQALSNKLSFNVGAGEFRTINTTTHYYGKRAGGSLSYQLSPRLSLNGGYNFAHQEGVQTSSFSPFLGNTNSFNLGLTWFLGAHSGL